MSPRLCTLAVVSCSWLSAVIVMGTSTAFSTRRCAVTTISWRPPACACDAVVSCAWAAVGVLIKSPAPSDEPNANAETATKRAVLSVIDSPCLWHTPASILVFSLKAIGTVGHADSLPHFRCWRHTLAGRWHHHSICYKLDNQHRCAECQVLAVGRAGAAHPDHAVLAADGTMLGLPTGSLRQPGGTKHN